MPDHSDMPMNMTARKHNIAGFTMLEVLISIVIIAFGLLGIAGLQAFALKNNHSASLRLTATSLAADMVDRMKTNVLAVGAGDYNAPTAAPYDAALIGGCTGGGCSATQMAQHDLADWGAKIKATLPGGTGVVCLDSTPNDGTGPGAAACDNVGSVGYVVKIWWSDDRTTKSTAAAATRPLFWTAFNP
jgi:type IV pilus assembly protein PilV